jgi:hypothetical protein
MNMSQSIQVAMAMINDLHNRIGFNTQKMVLCGFSGGAKVAISTQNVSGISSLIYIGATTPLNSSPVNLLGFAGQQDMNYTDVLQFYENSKGANPNSAMIEFDGKHEWPDAKVFENAFYWIHFQTERPKPDSSLIAAFAKKSNTAIASDKAKNDWVAAYQDCRAAFIFLNGISDVSSYKDQMNAIADSDPYKKATAQKAAILQKEVVQKQVLVQAFQNQNLDWWAKVISLYKASKDPSDKRLLGFISLACYSYSSQMLQQHNADGAERVLTIYELCDPDNTDQLYYHAELYAQKSNAAQAVKYLKKAEKNGFTDWQKILNEPSFISLNSDPAFAEEMGSLRKSAR